MRRTLVVPAAGRGSRLGGERPKLLVPVAGRPMIDWILDRHGPYVHAVVVVVHPYAQAAVSSHLRTCGFPGDFRLALQPEPTGMLDAVLAAGRDVAATGPERVWITWCDQVAVRPETLARLDAIDRASPAPDAALPTTRQTPPYIHFDRDAAGRLAVVRQRREGDPMPDTGESDAGLFSLSREAFLRDLPEFARTAPSSAGTHERNFLPFLPWLARDHRVVTFELTDPIEAIGDQHARGSGARGGGAGAAGGAMTSRPVLSVVIPAYNEERFLATLVERIRAVDLSGAGFDRELIVVDDCSTDRTAAIAVGLADVLLVRQPVNQGKGAAVRAGIGVATGDWVMIQDADLEYDPQDHLAMLEALKEPGIQVVYGSRYMKDRRASWLRNLMSGRHPNQTLVAYAGGQSLSVVGWLFTGTYLSDTVTALKLFPRDLLVSLALESSGFELDHEITAKVLARGGRIAEVPIRYFPRSRAEGKKIGARDWFRAVRTFARYRRG